jgi:hypothetical protein
LSQSELRAASKKFFGFNGSTDEWHNIYLELATAGNFPEAGMDEAAFGKFLSSDILKALQDKNRRQTKATKNIAPTSQVAEQKPEMIKDANAVTSGMDTEQKPKVNKEDQSRDDSEKVKMEKDAFSILDTDHDGRLSQSELRAASKKFFGFNGSTDEWHNIYLELATAGNFPEAGMDEAAFEKFLSTDQGAFDILKDKSRQQTEAKKDDASTSQDAKQKPEMIKDAIAVTSGMDAEQNLRVNKEAQSNDDNFEKVNEKDNVPTVRADARVDLHVDAVHTVPADVPTDFRVDTVHTPPADIHHKVKEIKGRWVDLHATPR